MVPSLKDPESNFCKGNKERRKEKDMPKEGVKPNEKESEYLAKSESEKESKPKDEMANISEMTMEEYKITNV